MEIYHVLNRGVDKRQVFMDKQDHLRFIHDLYEFNDQDRVETTYFKFRDFGASGRVATSPNKKHRKLLVDILAFCLMPNHYHILLKPKVERGMSLFMQKLNAGYTKYFNQKYERTGALFQGRYKQVPVIDETHFLHLPFYIHFNPLDLSHPEWRENKIANPEKALEFLKSFRWSSHLDYSGIKNFPSVLNSKVLMEVFESNKDYEKLVESYLKDIQIDPEVTLE
ncbi:MAG: transposase [Candidatus Yanofskybacteria bacterium]|nr:transposase [Candidatus Yanofskybacteria bacterium]